MTRDIIMGYLIFGEFLALISVRGWKFDTRHHLSVLYLALMALVAFWPAFLIFGFRRR